MVCCAIFSPDLEKAKNYIESKNIEIIKSYACSSRHMEWRLANGERWIWFPNWYEYHRGYRFYKLAVDINFNIDIFQLQIKHYANSYCCSLDIIE